MIDIKIDESNLRNLEHNIESIQGKLPQVISRSINRSLEMVRTEQLRKTTSRYTVKRSKLLETINLVKSNNSNLSGKLTSKGGMIGLDYLKLNPKKRGKTKKTVHATVKKGEGGSLPNSFIAYHDGRLGAFKRVSRSSLPIKRLKGPSAPQMLGEMSIIEYLQGYAEDKFNMRFEHELGRVIK